MIEKLLDWHLDKHPHYAQGNLTTAASLEQLEILCTNLLLPLEQQFGKVAITYGFTSAPLLRYILKNSPGDMAPSIDQHAAMEVNSRGNRICKRDGAACDLYIAGYEQHMDIIASYIAEHLPFDRLYFYGKDRPLHLSTGPEPARYALIRHTRADGIRVNKQSAYGNATPQLFNQL